MAAGCYGSDIARIGYGCDCRDCTWENNAFRHALVARREEEGDCDISFEDSSSWSGV